MKARDIIAVHRGSAWCRWDIGSLYDLPPGPRSEGLSIDLNNPV